MVLMWEIFPTCRTVAIRGSESESESGIGSGVGRGSCSANRKAPGYRPHLPYFHEGYMLLLLNRCLHFCVIEQTTIAFDLRPLPTETSHVFCIGPKFHCKLPTGNL